MWPLPDLYLLEIIAVSILGMWAIWSNGSGRSPFRGILTWAVVGFIFAFVIMGVFSIGVLFLPVACLFTIAAILSFRSHGYLLVLYLGVGLAAALAQGAMMLVVIRFLLP